MLLLNMLLLIGGMKIVTVILKILKLIIVTGVFVNLSGGIGMAKDKRNTFWSYEIGVCPFCKHNVVINATKFLNPIETYNIKCSYCGCILYITDLEIIDEKDIRT